MKTQILLLAVIIGILATGSAYAAKDDGDGNPQRNRFERLDEDGNGRVDSQEFAKASAVRFGHMDADGDGAVTLAELEDRARREHVERRFKRMDADEDGRVTEAEFTAAGDRLFQHLDENEDGYLSMGELERRRHGGGDGGKSAN
jgi:Ca2+-binding EF-hand superfamily protein